MILTYSRTTVIQASLAVILFPLINRGSGAAPVFFLCIAALLFGDRAMSALPTQMASSRIATIGNITDDHSFQGRLALFGIAATQSLREPLGLGIGSMEWGFALRLEVSAEWEIARVCETLRPLGSLALCLSQAF